MVSEYKRSAVLSRREAVIEVGDYNGPDRRESKTITRDEFDNFVQCSTSYRMDTAKQLKSIHTALFAANADNEHGQAGLMHTARRIEQHIDAVCNLAKWARNGIVGVATLISACAAAGHALGWW